MEIVVNALSRFLLTFILFPFYSVQIQLCLDQICNGTNGSLKTNGELGKIVATTQTSHFSVDSTTEEPFDETTAPVPASTTIGKTVTPSTLPSTTQAIGSTTSTTKQTPTAPPFVTKTPLTSICWCDLKANVCDINCCCDSDCTISHTQVFTECERKPAVWDSSTCYSSDIFFRKPNHVSLLEQSNYFCVVRDNLHHMKEFKPRQPIKTTDDFKRELKKIKNYEFNEALHIVRQAYKAGDILWVVRGEFIEPFQIPAPLFGDICLTTKYIHFLKDIKTKCKTMKKSDALHSSIKQDVVTDFLFTRLITSPLLLNESDTTSIVKNCTTSGACVSIDILTCENYPSKDSCQMKNSVLRGKPFYGHINLNIQHNGTEGIYTVIAYVWADNLPRLSIDVFFTWFGEDKVAIPRSGNPGYLEGRPVLAGQRIVLPSNDSSVAAQEAIELSSNTNNWLNVQGVEGFQCSLRRRTPVLFNINNMLTCSFSHPLQSKENCTHLQLEILEFLFGNDILNVTSGSMNKYIGIFGNSVVENIDDWVKILVDNSQLIFPSLSYRSFNLGRWCRGVVNTLYIDIAVSKFGSFSNPQSKIVGALYHFGSPKNLFVRNYSITETPYVKIKLKTVVTFHDVSKAPVKEFAKPPGLEAKLPYDFFYPFFFSKAYSISVTNQNVCLNLFVGLLYFFV